MPSPGMSKMPPGLPATGICATIGLLMVDSSPGSGTRHLLPNIPLYGYIGVLLFLASRLLNLTLLPVVTDEGNYIDCAQKVLAGQIFYSLPRASTALPIWLIAALLPLGGDALWTARALSAAFGLVGALACYAIGTSLYSQRRVGVVAAVLYGLNPFMLFHDRIALVDGPLCTMGLLVFGASLSLLRGGRWWQAVCLGLAMGLGLLTKTSAALFWLTPLLTFVLMAGEQRAKPPWKLLLLAFGLCLVLMTPLFLYAGHFVNYLIDGKSIYDRPLSVMPDIWQENARQMLEWLWRYWTAPLFILALVAFALAIIRRERRGLLLSILCTWPIIFFVLSSQTEKWFSRYVVFTTPPMLILVAGLLVEASDAFPGRWLKSLPGSLQRGSYLILVPALLLCSLPALQFGYWLLADPAQTPLAPADRVQYVEGWPAGYGLAGAAALLREQAALHGRILVARNEGSGPANQGLALYLGGDERITLEIFDLRKEESWQELEQQMRQEPTFLVLNPPQERKLAVDLESYPYVRLLGAFPKPGDISRIEVYALQPTLPPSPSQSGGEGG
jgi:4-amino-4-deoxy-L-arabinose transferase-like glycosyltransferase